MSRERNKRWRVKLLVFSTFLGVVVLFVFLFWNGNDHLEEINKVSEFVEINHQRLKQTILDLQSMRERSSWEKQAETSHYLQRRLKEMGLLPEIRTYFYKDSMWENIVVSFPTHNQPDRKMLVIAHYDSKRLYEDSDAPGADDNASGIAALLELADVLRNCPYYNTVQLVFFSNEEYGRSGSLAFAKKMRQEGEDIKGVINIDIVGYNAPTAILSSEIFTLLGSDFPMKRKAKMLAKMNYNWINYLLRRSQKLKVMARAEDRHLIQAGMDANKEFPLNLVRWIVGDICV